MKITVETVVKAKLNKLWDAWNNPADIKQWNTAQDDWHTTRSTVDLREGGKFQSRMEAKDGSEGFDFEGTYTRIVSHKTIEYRISDGREVKVEFIECAGGVLVLKLCYVRFDLRTTDLGLHFRERLVQLIILILEVSDGSLGS